MPVTMIWTEAQNSWIGRERPIAVGLGDYSLYVLSGTDAGEEIHDKRLIAIKADVYRDTLKEQDVYAEKTGDSTPRIPDKAVVVGMDQWAMTTVAKGADVFTSGIVGCIGLVLVSNKTVCVTHLLDGFEIGSEAFARKFPDRKADDVWTEFKGKLDTMRGKLPGQIDSAHIVSSNAHVHKHKVELIQDWLEEGGVTKATQKVHDGSNAFAMRVIGGKWCISTADRPGDRYRGKTVTVSAAGESLEDKGDLSGNAMDSGA